MSKLSKGELIKAFEEMWDATTIGDTWKLNEHAVQAFNQIKGLIQNQPEVDKEFIETALERLNDCCQIGSCSGRDSEWGELDREKAEKALRQTFKDAGIRIKED